MSSSVSTESRTKRKNLAESNSIKEAMDTAKTHKCWICSKSYIHPSALTHHIFISHTNERPYKCKVCGRSSKTLAHFKKHRSLHLREKKYPCSKCSSIFSSGSDRTKHLKKVHNNIWPCEICKRVLSSKNHLLRHNQTHSNLKQFECVICEHRSRTLPNLMSHITYKHTLEKAYLCSKCPEEYTASSTLKRHLVTAHGQAEWFKHKCPLCDKKFILQAALNNHMKTHTGEKPYPCSVCGKKFTSQSQVKRHMLIHTGEKPFECTVCWSRFASKSMRNQHAKIHNKKFSCNICFKMYPSAFFLKEHEKRHTGVERPFKCEECSNSYFEKGQLNAHVRQLHRRRRPYACSMCNKSFYRPSMRDKHLAATHLNEKPYKCTICDKRLKGGLTTHIKHHNQLTDLSCVACPKRFLNRTDLIEHHFKKHVGGNYDLLTCVFCNKKFYKIRPLENHINIHTQERPYFCSICNGDFFTERALRAHQRTQHGKRRS